MNVEEKLRSRGLALPEPGRPVGTYLGAVRTGNLVFVSGHGPRRPGGHVVTGKLGRDLSIDQGYDAARMVVLACLASLKKEIGSLDRVKRVVKLLGMVNCTEDFLDHPKVINGASDLLVDLYGEEGCHARSAVGMQSLPGGIAVEIEMVVEVDGR